jgi:hypothetical protein
MNFSRARNNDFVDSITRTWDKSTVTKVASSGGSLPAAGGIFGEIDHPVLFCVDTFLYLDVRRGGAGFDS